MLNICKKHLSVLLVPIGLLTLGLSSCQDTADQPEAVSAAEQSLRNKLQHYYANLPGQSRSGSSISIKETEQRHYVIVEDTVIESPQTRAFDPNSFDITRVSFDIEGKEGFAIISEDERLDHVYYFTDNGCISDTAQIGGLKWLIGEIPNFAAAELVSDDNETVTRATLHDINIAPIVRFEWGQGYPFNILTPYCKCSSCSDEVLKNHNPIGCTTVALAQTIATIGKFNGTYFGSRNINFSTLPSKGEDFSSMLGQEIAHFFHEIAINCQTKFSCSGGTSSLKYAYNYLQDLKYDCVYATGDIIVENLISSLMKGFPHIMGGNNTLTGAGHVWIIDGIKVKNGKYEFSCKWGKHGKCDGWSYGNPYTMTDSYKNEIYYSDGKVDHIYIN